MSDSSALSEAEDRSSASDHGGGSDDDSSELVTDSEQAPGGDSSKGKGKAKGAGGGSGKGKGRGRGSSSSREDSDEAGGGGGSSSEYGSSWLEESTESGSSGAAAGASRRTKAKGSEHSDSESGSSSVSRRLGLATNLEDLSSSFAGDIIPAVPDGLYDDVAGPGGPVTTTELRGWYMYDFAQSGFLTGTISVLIPLLITIHATAEAEYYPKNCDADFPVNDTDSTTSDGGGGGSGTECFTGFDAPTCSLAVSFLGSHIAPSAITLTFISISVAFQVLVFISLGALADYGSYRKTLLMAFSTVAALMNAALVFLWDSELWWLVGVFTIALNTCFGTSIVFYNAFLPVLVDNHPDVLYLKKVRGLSLSHLCT